MRVSFALRHGAEVVAARLRVTKPLLAVVEHDFGSRVGAVAAHQLLKLIHAVIRDLKRQRVCERRDRATVDGVQQSGEPVGDVEQGRVLCAPQRRRQQAAGEDRGDSDATLRLQGQFGKRTS